jgi:hypothetical protein
MKFCRLATIWPELASSVEALIRVSPVMRIDDDEAAKSARWQKERAHLTGVG